MPPLLLGALLGAIVNVAVAWGFAVYSDVLVRRPTVAYMLRAGEWIRVLEWTTRGASVVATRSLRDLSLHELPSDQVQLAGWQLPPPGRADSVRDHLADDRGWPFLSMWSEWRYIGPSRNQRTVRGGMEADFARVDAFGPPPVLPLLPIWPGLAVNSLVFAAPIWLLLVLRASVPRPITRIPISGS